MGHSYNSTWQTPMNQSVLNWNNTPTKTGFTKSSNSNNYIYASQYSWSAYGKRTGTYIGNKLTSYTIRLKMRKQVQIITILVVSVFLFTSCSTAAKDNEKTTVITIADYPYYEDESAIYEKASLVIRAKVIDKRMEYMSQVIELTKEQKDDPQLNNVQSLYSIEDDKIISHEDNDFNMTIEKLEKLPNDKNNN